MNPANTAHHPSTEDAAAGATMDAVASAWATLVGTSAHASAWLARVDRAYAEPHRAYHARSHLAALWRLASEAEALGDCGFSTARDAARVILLAACFHDYVYNPRASAPAANEAASADMFDAFCRDLPPSEAIPPDHAALIRNIILSTATHVPDPPESHLCKLFLDLDLSVLGAPWELYSEYASGIRKEYDCFDDAQFNDRRKKVLTAFLRRDALYYTPLMKERFEANARRNIQREIDQLLL
ncbi:hypothetical protein HDU83_006635 [Entophlyctis luteolus]|nr:hypothetical protein HDU83_006635 [Entophlyctis luteolus]